MSGGAEGRGAVVEVKVGHRGVEVAKKMNVAAGSQEDCCTGQQGNYNHPNSFGRLGSQRRPCSNIAHSILLVFDGKLYSIPLWIHWTSPCVFSLVVMLFVVILPGNGSPLHN
ncbi:hypothetical protein CC2G_006020 [Coprinopsis cinerea AmutBmut pab1-1]|nr:hypothetical protein CC2G_006020 [Coprinopsis cinerea AmutBmut pab1-1]